MQDGGRLALDVSPVELTDAAAIPVAVGSLSTGPTSGSWWRTPARDDRGSDAADVRAVLHHQGSEPGDRLGLSVVHGSCSGTRGACRAKRAGRGTRFEVYLPVWDQSLASDLATRAPSGEVHGSAFSSSTTSRTWCASPNAFSQTSGTRWWGGLARRGAGSPVAEPGGFWAVLTDLTMPSCRVWSWPDTCTRWRRPFPCTGHRVPRGGFPGVAHRGLHRHGGEQPYAVADLKRAFDQVRTVVAQGS